MYYTWEKGDVLYVTNPKRISYCYIKLTYEDRNKLKSNINPNIYFNETLFPKYFIGQVLYLDDNTSHIMKPYEIVRVEKNNVTQRKGGK